MNAKEMEQWFITMYEAEADVLFRFCLFKLRDREAATDITQETFTRMWQYVANGSAIENFRAFAFRTARNAVADYVKKRRPLYEYELGEKADDILNGSVPADAENYAELRGALECLKGLSDEDQELVLLRYTEGMQVKDIGEATHTLPNTITQRLKRAVQSLQECMGIVTT